MRIGRFIIGGFISKYGIQIELGLWFKPNYWLCLLLKSIFGYAFFGLYGVEGGPVAYGLEKHGKTWHFTWSKRDKEKYLRSLKNRGEKMRTKFLWILLEKYLLFNYYLIHWLGRHHLLTLLDNDIQWVYNWIFGRRQLRLVHQDEEPRSLADSGCPSGVQIPLLRQYAIGK